MNMKPIYLEKWLHERIRSLASEDPSFSQFMNYQDLERIDRQDIDRYHLYKLREIVSYAQKNSFYYRNRFQELGIQAEQINTFEDFRGLPLTSPEDFAENPYHFVCVSLADVERVTTFTSSGTTGPEKRIFFTKEDLECMTDFMAVGIRAVADEHDVIQILLPSGRINDQTDLLCKGVQKMGARPVPSGIVPNAEKQLDIIEKEKTSIIFGVVNPVYRITQDARFNHNLSQKGIKALFLTSEYLSNSMRKYLEEVWGCPVHIHYGLTEMGLGVAVECGARDGFHYNEADLFVEIVDPETGYPVEVGEEGELVFTSLSFKGTPLIRYRTHDIAHLIPKHCACGTTTLVKFSNVTKRLESIIKIEDNIELYPSYFDELLFADPNIIDFQVVLTGDEKKDVILLRVEAIECSQEAVRAIKNRLHSDPIIAKLIFADNPWNLEIEFVNKGELLQLGRMKRMIIDQRKFRK
jgi:phenylacetate-CoA ligase